MLKLRHWAFCFCSVSFFLTGQALAQGVIGSGNTEGQALLLKLYPPAYPQMARVARVSGDVDVEVEVHPDGSVASASIIGSPLQKQAALDSVQKSLFACRSCSHDAKLSLVYTFGLRQSGCDYGYKRVRSLKCAYLWRCGEHRYTGIPPSVTQSQNHITILVDSMCVETSASGTRTANAWPAAEQ